MPTSSFHRRHDWFEVGSRVPRARVPRDLYKVIFQRESDRNGGSKAGIASSLVVLCTTRRATRLVQRTCPTISSVTAASFIKSPFIGTNTTIAKRSLVTRSWSFSFFLFLAFLIKIVARSNDKNQATDREVSSCPLGSILKNQRLKISFRKEIFLNQRNLFLGHTLQFDWNKKNVFKAKRVSMMSRIFVFPLYFWPPSYFLTKEDISMKFLKMIENMLVHVGLVHWRLYF